jgi:Tfp pilus assembly protein PilN
MNAPNQLDFLPEDYLERKARRRTILICAVLAGIVMAAIGAAFSITERINRQADQRKQEVDLKYAEEAKQIQQIQQVEQKQQKMARQAELAASLLEKIPRSNILAEVTNAVPSDVSLLEFSLNSIRRSAPAAVAASDPTKASAAAQPQPIAYDVQLKVSGIAANDVQVAEFIRRLSHDDLFQDVNLIISDEFSQGEEKKLRRFQVEMNLNQNANVNALKAKPAGSNTTAALPQN